MTLKDFIDFDTIFQAIVIVCMLAPAIHELTKYLRDLARTTDNKKIASRVILITEWADQAVYAVEEVGGMIGADKKQKAINLVNSKIAQHIGETAVDDWQVGKYIETAVTKMKENGNELKDF